MDERFTKMDERFTSLEEKVDGISDQIAGIGNILHEHDRKIEILSSIAVREAGMIGKRS